MTGIELEEGEAYFPQDGDDEHIDPDKDFSYIDKKIENVLGHYQKDFMRGLSAEILGARFGGYGSFLPVHQRSPSISSNQRTQSHISSEYPRNLPSEHPPQNPTTVANHSVPARSGPASSDHGIQALPESRICSMNNQSKLQRLLDGWSNDEQKKPIVHHPAQKSLKLRVKMTFESAFSRDNSAIYSGLGLDISPSSSPKDSPSQCDGSSPDMQGMKPESPTYIVKLMTSFPPAGKEMLSPLHHSLVCLVGTENNLQAASLGCAVAVPAEGKSKANKDRKSKVKDPSKDRKSKQRESSKERKSNKKLHVKPMELVKENHECLADAVALSANKREDTMRSLVKEVAPSNASTNAVDACSEEKGLAATRSKTACSGDPDFFIKKGEVECLGDATEKSAQQVQISRDKAKGKPMAMSSRDPAVMDEGNMKALRGKMQKEKNFSFITSKGSHADEGNEVRFREEDANKLLKQPALMKDRVKDVVVNSRFPKEDSVREKENGKRKNILDDQQVDSFPVKTVEANDKHHDLSGKMRDLNVETLKSSKQKPHSKLMLHSQMGMEVPSGNEHLSSLAKKKSRESQTNSTSPAGPPRGCLMAGSLAAENEEAILVSNIPCISKRVSNGLEMEMRKDGDLAGNVFPGKKGKDLSMKDSVMGVSVRETTAFAGKLKEKSRGKKIGLDTNVGLNMEGHPSGGNSVTEQLPVGDVLPTDIEDWVLCEKCEKWRLLPLGMNPDFLPKEWTCSMITWLPGKNSCSVSEDETTNGLRALYQGQVLGPHMRNIQLADPHGTAFLHASPGVQHDNITGGGRKKHLLKAQMNASKQSGSQEHISVKKDQQHSGEMKSSKHQKGLVRDLDAVGIPGYCNPSKLEKKRATDVKASGVSKKTKRVHQHTVGNLVFGLSTGQSPNYDPTAQRISNDDFAKRSSEYPLTKSKDRTHNSITVRHPDLKDTSQKKRKLKDQQESVVSTVELPAKRQHQRNNSVIGKSSGTEHGKEKKLKVLNIPGREYSAEKVNGGTVSNDRKHNQGGSGADSLTKGGRRGYVALERHHSGRASQKTNGRKSSEMAPDFGASDNATTSSSSKISHKVKAKVKCSPAGSISSSPFRVSKSCHGNEPEKLSAKQLKLKAECATNEIAPPKEELRDRKSNLSRDSGIVSDAVEQDCSVKKMLLERCPDAHRREEPILEGHKDTSGKLNRIRHERYLLTSQQKSVSENQDTTSVKGLHLHGNNSEKGKSHVSQRSSDNSHGLPRTERVHGSNAAIVDNFNLKPHPTGHMSKAIEASSSMKKDIFPWDANTALKEATNLRDSADRLKISGSGLESTEALFQAALKFLHGASLLEPGSNEGGKYGEMTPTAAYSTTAKLCEHCAHEYERCNDMASAALAYKCMEVAYMRIVYSNNLAASRDRVELDMAVRAAPQVESPSSSASDIDSLNNQVVGEVLKGGNSILDQQNHVISARNRPNFVRLLNFTQHVNLAMEASRRSQSAFAAANPVLTLAGKVEGIAFIKRVLDFGFHDVGGLLHLMKLAMDALNART